MLAQDCNYIKTSNLKDMLVLILICLDLNNTIKSVALFLNINSAIYLNS
jgi:hypothetical protein